MCTEIKGWQFRQAAENGGQTVSGQEPTGSAVAAPAAACMALAAHEEHLVAVPRGAIVDLERRHRRRFLGDGPVDEQLLLLELLRVREQLLLQLVGDVALDQDVFGVALCRGRRESS